MTQNGIANERLRTMQIIAEALMMGVVMFAAVAVFTALGKAAGDPFVAYWGAGVAVMALVAQSFVPAAMANTAIGQLRQTRQPEGEEQQTDELVAIFQTKMIVGLAILEGAAFFNLVACIVSVQWWSLGVVGVLVLAMAMNFPTRFKVESWIENKQHELNLGN